MRASAGRDPAADARAVQANGTPTSRWEALRQQVQVQGQAIRRVGWGVADQGMSSLTNFVVVIAVARTLGAEQLGAFSLAYVTYGFALNASRGLATDPLMVRFGGGEVPAWRRAVASSSGTAAVVGLTIGAAMLAVAAFLPSGLGGPFAGLGLTLPGLLIQDSWRYAFFALGRGGHAFLNDLLWGVLLVPALVVARVTGHASAFSFMLVWGLIACVAAAIGMVQTRIIPRPLQVGHWLSQHRDLAYRYAAEGVSSTIAGQLRTYGVGLILGLAAVGYLQAANTLMGPYSIILLGTTAVVVPEVGRILRRSPDHLLRACLLVAAALAAIGMVMGGLLLVLLFGGLGQLLLGDIWGPTSPLVAIVLVGMLGGSLQAGAVAGLHALGAARESLRAMLLVSAVYLGCALAGAAAWGTVGAAWGQAAAMWLGSLVSWWHLELAWNATHGTSGERRRRSLPRHARRGVPRRPAKAGRQTNAASREGPPGSRTWDDPLPTPLLRTEPRPKGG